MNAQPTALETRQDTVKLITEYLGDELEQVHQTLRQTLDSDSRLIREVGEYIGLTTGKKLRPMMHLLASRAFAPELRPSIETATALELIHVATLIHDDVIDKATTRRGQPSVNAKFGDDVAILMADFLYAKAFDLALVALRPEYLQVICRVTQKMCEGEMFQIELRERMLTARDYLRVVECKTGQLFSACMSLGALAAGRSDAETRAAAEFGRSFGIAFQITDDTLDYVARDDRWGKDVGMDVAAGKQTLPLLLTLERAAPKDREDLLHQWGNGRDFDSILRIVERYDGVKLAVEQARDFARTAVEQLERIRPADPIAFQHLADLPSYVLDRRF